MSKQSVRMGLGLLVAAYALFSGGVGFLNVFMLRVGMTPFYIPAKMTDFLGVLTGLPWWQFMLWPLAIVLYFVAAYRLLTGKTAAKIFAVALVCDLLFLTILKVSGAVHSDPKAIDLDYVTAIVTLAIGAAIWWTERTPAAQANPTVDI